MGQAASRGSGAYPRGDSRDRRLGTHLVEALGGGEFAEKFGDFKMTSVEIFGGSSRVPAIKQIVKTVFDVEPSTHLNADEAIARGCALQCAILSPNFKIAKSLKILDGTSFHIEYG